MKPVCVIPKARAFTSGPRDLPWGTGGPEWWTKKRRKSEVTWPQSLRRSI